MCSAIVIRDIDVRASTDLRTFYQYSRLRNQRSETSRLFVAIGNVQEWFCKRLRTRRGKSVLRVLLAVVTGMGKSTIYLLSFCSDIVHRFIIILYISRSSSSIQCPSRNGLS